MPPAARPNVVFIVMDDLAWGDLACHGNPFTKTPNLDRLHAASTRLTRYYSGPLCSPARAGIMTGRYHLRTRCIDTYLGRSMLDPSERTLPQAFRAGGYRTGLFGKWHLGDCYPMRPCDLGFETALYHKGGGIGQPGDHPANHARGGESYFDPVLFRDGVPEPARGYCTDLFFDETLRFAEARREEPFFAYLATNTPHGPLVVGDAWSAPYKQLGLPEKHANLYGMVANIDWNLGRLTRGLEKLGLADRTLVIFTSDHGPCPSSLEKDQPPERQARFNSGLRGMKGQLYDGGVRVPCLWKLPGTLAPGRDLGVLAHTIDVLPTLSELCGLPASGAKLDGVSLWPYLKGARAPEAAPARTVFMQWHRGDAPIRYRNAGAIEARFKWYRPEEDAPDELYDLPADPFETRNLAADLPAETARLRARYDAWFDDVSSTRPDNYAPPRIHVGTEHESPTVLSRQDWRVHGKDGWMDRHYGHWEVKLCAPGPYRVTVRFSKPAEKPGTLRVQLAGRAFEAPLEAGCAEARLETSALPLGDTQVEAWGECEGERISPLYVELA
ncbi:MAG: arylsulfatase [Planctomycetota bacterium]|nr:arylsulfatase [Planctomycetota bacterium]